MKAGIKLQYNFKKAKKVCHGCTTFHENEITPCCVQINYKDFEDICPCIDCLIKIKCTTMCKTFRKLCEL
jgi:hypothetical protein